MKLSYFKRFPPTLAQLLPGSSRAAGSGKACSARRLQRLRYIHALNMHVCNIYPSSMGVRNIHALNMHVCNIYRCIKNDVYLFLLTGSFSGLATMQGAAGQWLARGFGYGAAYLGGQRCWGGEELVTTLTRGSLADRQQAWVVFSLPSIVFRALTGMLAATGAARNQYRVKILFSSFCNPFHAEFAVCLSLPWVPVASC